MIHGTRAAEQTVRKSTNRLRRSSASLSEGRVLSIAARRRLREDRSSCVIWRNVSLLIIAAHPRVKATGGPPLAHDDNSGPQRNGQVSTPQRGAAGPAAPGAGASMTKEQSALRWAARSGNRRRFKIS